MRSTISDKLEKIQEFSFDDAETNLVVRAKIFLETRENINDTKTNSKYLQQDFKNKIGKNEERNYFGCCQVSRKTTNYY